VFVCVAQLASLVHSTHTAGLAARLQAGALLLVQSVSAVQLGVQVLFAQTSPAVVQLASVRQSTHVFVVLQNCVPQSVSARHSTQTVVAGLQSGVFPEHVTAPQTTPQVLFAVQVSGAVH
jgi:hypothetical protein